MVRLAQLVRASDCGSEGRGFETHISPRNGRIDDASIFVEATLKVLRTVQFATQKVEKLCNCKKISNFASHLVGSRPAKLKVNTKSTYTKMKKDIHPKEYREVCFKDMSNDETFITRSTVASRETIEIDGKEYPLVKLEITSSSHPFFTGKQKLVDTAGRVDKFRSRYGNRVKK